MAATAKTKARKTSTRAATKAAAAPRTTGPDAISLLIADHREVDDYFDEYETLTDDAAKKTLADKICLALKVHAQIEEEFFYPPAREETGDGDLIDEAIVEHMGAKTLIAQIEAGAWKKKWVMKEPLGMQSQPRAGWAVPARRPVLAYGLQTPSFGGSGPSYDGSTRAPSNAKRPLCRGRPRRRCRRR